MTQLWLQEKVRKGEIVVNKVGADDNLFDALKKGLDAVAIHLEGVGIEIRNDRHRIAPELNTQVQGAEDRFEDERGFKHPHLYFAAIWVTVCELREEL